MNQMESIDDWDKLENFNYELPEDRIAQHPVEPRHSSKLLQYFNGKITHHTFSDLPELLSTGSTLVFNNTKVLPARLIGVTETGRTVEVFLLNPIANQEFLPEVMANTQSTDWNCLVGGKRKWHENERVLVSGSDGLTLTWINRENGTVRLTWKSGLPFRNVVERSGNVPLPPYIARPADIIDKISYQTVYAEKLGAVAAPTAGLHFTNEIIDSLIKRQINTCYVTLHVGAGTFLPVKTERITQHQMHSEWISADINLLKQMAASSRVIAVGTTSLRTLESLYWLGIKWMVTQEKPDNLSQFEHEHYEKISENLSFKVVIHFLIEQLSNLNTDNFSATTAIMITPKYKIRSTKALITNFHQPKSTLLALIGAVAGSDWRIIYNQAIENNYRFLSYGDSSLLYVKY